MSAVLAPLVPSAPVAANDNDGNLKRVKSAVNGNLIYNIYNLAGELVHVDEETANRETDYVRLGGRTVARVVNKTTPTYVHSDHLGSPVARSDTGGTVLPRERYTPFGLTLNNPTDLDDQAGFTGHIKDSATGLNYMQARYYDPIIGRFLSIDPVTFMSSGGDPRFFNRYAYCYNDPINCTDPSGRNGVGLTDTDRAVIKEHLNSSNTSMGELATAAGGMVIDFVPVVGDAKGIGEAIANPTKANIAAAAMGIVPVVGDVAGKGVKAAARHSPEKQALTEMAKLDKKTGGITEGDMDAYKQLNSELPDPYPSNTVRGPESHPTASAPTSQQPHGHVGPVDHIPIKPDEP